MTTLLTTPARHLAAHHTQRGSALLAPPPAKFDRVERAVADIAAGRMVVLLDDSGSVPEGDLVIAAQRATTPLVASMVRHGSGFITAPMAAHDCERLELPPMQPAWDYGRAPAYTVAVDARSGIGTGISAADRATTLRVLADASTVADDLTRPGHVVPIHTSDGVQGRPEAAVELVRAAGLRPAAATCTIVSVHVPTTMAAPDELRDFAAEHGLTTVTLSDVVRWHRERPSNACIPGIVESFGTLANHRECQASRPDGRVSRSQ